MTNKRIARHLREVGQLLELTGAAAFRTRAYEQASRVVDRLGEPAAPLAERGRLTEVPGIGEGIQAEVRAFVETESSPLRERLLAEIPPGLPELLRVQRLGARRARQLWQQLGVTSLDALEEAARDGSLAGLKGFGRKTALSILENVERMKRYRTRRLLARASEQVGPVLERLRAECSAEPCGELRRGLETVAAAELVVGAGEAGREPLRRLLMALAPPADAPEEADDAWYAGVLPDGLPLRVYAAAPEDFGTTLWRRTGSEAHVADFVERFGAPAGAASEEAVYARAGLPFVPPELREGDGELDAAARDSLPRLLTVEDLRGTLHNHSTYSDGAHSIREMAAAARRRGLSYFGLCDHSRSLQIANGLSVERLRRQVEEVRALNAAFEREGGPPFRIFAGTECDILADGTLDFPDEVLAGLDFVVVSVHQGFEMTEEEATTRILRALENPHTRILGHPTGRLLLAREGYRIDHRRVIEACARLGVSIELNANPRRLDLDWRWVREAAGLGVLVSINPDAHSVDDLANDRWGVLAARKGWLTAERCLNALPLDEFTRWIERRRG